MIKEPKTLPQAIKIVVGIYGKKVVNDVQMVNIMNDVVSLEDPSAVKTILRDCVKLGYGGKILAISPKDDFHIKIKNYSKIVSDSLGYKEVIVQYILYSIAYGIGVCPNEPYLDNLRSIKPEKKIKKVSGNGVSETVVEHKTPYKTIAACFFVILLGGAIWAFSYWKSSADRELFDNKVYTGNSLLSSGDYENAVESYKDAYISYNAINSSSYKRDALEKIDMIVDKLIKEGQNSNKSLLQSYKVLQSELQLNLDTKDRDRIQAKLDETERIITERTENGRNTLITNISANNGKLDEASLILLGELLELAPNDYWLNFIKKKSNE